MRVTQDILEAGISKNGAWNRDQLEAILPANEFTGPGTWSIRKGWKQRLIGSEVPKYKIDKFLELKDKHLKLDKTGSLF